MDLMHREAPIVGRRRCERRQIPSSHRPLMPGNRCHGSWRAVWNGHGVTDSGAGYVGCESEAGLSPPARATKAPRVVAAQRRGIDPELCPFALIDPGYIGRLGAQVPLGMPTKLPLMDQTCESLHALDGTLYGVSQLVAAGERVPYLDDEGIGFTGLSLPSDLQRRSA